VRVERNDSESRLLEGSETPRLGTIETIFNKMKNIRTQANKTDYGGARPKTTVQNGLYKTGTETPGVKPKKVDSNKKNCQKDSNKENWQKDYRDATEHDETDRSFP